MSRLRTPSALGLAATLLLTVPFWLQWLDPRLNLWDVDDSKNHLIRLYHLEWLIRNGVWYPRWVPELYLGYGYPLFNYYAPAFYYLTLALKAVTRTDFWDAFKLSGVFAVLLGASGMYALARTIWHRTLPAIFAALAFTYAPYVFAVNLYKRGDIPEALALALIPWLLHATWRVGGSVARARAAPLGGSSAEPWWAWAKPTQFARAARRSAASPGRRSLSPSILYAGLLGALLILTHNVTALLGALLATLLATYLLSTNPTRRTFLHLLYSALLALGLSAWFWLPAILEVRFVQLDWL
ncbi:MAG TPA: 6-pyruvoyl-tetrahydropterin synthase-related protein, partial [Chloroflexota bacterium]|nr:6-pyruvoyl-tetrahydropterin synthase-related protein [Chloroflexota bacterium]